MDWLFEGSWTAYAALLATSFSLFIIWFFQRGSAIAWLTALPLLFIPILMGLDNLIETQREQARGILKKIESLVNSGNLVLCTDLLDEKFISKGGLNKKALRDWLAKNQSKSYYINYCVFWGEEIIQTTVYNTTKISTMVKTKGSSGIYQEGFYRMEFVFSKAPDGKLKAILEFKVYDPISNGNEITPQF